MTVVKRTQEPKVFGRTTGRERDPFQPVVSPELARAVIHREGVLERDDGLGLGARAVGRRAQVAEQVLVQERRPEIARQNGAEHRHHVSVRRHGVLSSTEPLDLGPDFAYVLYAQPARSSTGLPTGDGS